MTQDPENKDSLLIIKSKPQAVTAAETFLRNRKWDVFTSTDLKEALTLIAKEQPRYVMISVDHPNKKVRQLPRLLIQAFPVIPIAFAETASGAAVSAIQDLGLKYSIFPPISGPAVERMMNKIKRDLAAEQNARQSSLNKDSQHDKSGSDKADRSNNIQISGKSSSSHDRMNPVYGGSSNSFDRDAVMRFMKSEGDSTEDVAFVDSLSDSSSEQESEVARAVSSGIAYQPEHQIKPRENKDPIIEKSGLKPLDGYFPDHLPHPEKRNQTEQAQDPTAKAMNFFAPDPESKTDSWGEGESSNQKNSPSHHGQSRSEKKEALEARSVKPALNLSQPESETRENRAEKKIPKFTMAETPDGTPSAAPDYQNLMKNATQKALDESVHKAPAKREPEKIQDTTQVVCILIESPNFVGYLVAALGKNRTLDTKFEESVRKKLKDFLKENGEESEVEEGFPLQIHQIEFENWALEYGDFLKKAVHNGEEVAMAFFPVEPKAPNIGESKDAQMAAVGIDDFFEDSTLNFDVYIYLPHNDKYILYTPQGRIFYGEQKERLKNKGVSQLHIRKENVVDVKKYHTQNFLNSKIESYKGLKAK